MKNNNRKTDDVIVNYKRRNKMFSIVYYILFAFCFTYWIVGCGKAAYLLEVKCRDKHEALEERICRRITMLFVFVNETGLLCGAFHARLKNQNAVPYLLLEIAIPLLGLITSIKKRRKIYRGHVFTTCLILAELTLICMSV